MRSLSIQILLLAIAYGALTALLMMINTIVLQLGDAKFGVDGWRFYWPIWATVFTPVVLVGILMVIAISTTGRSAWPFLFITLGSALLAMEFSFVLDLSWQVLAVEVILLTTGVFLFGRTWLRRDA